jgi:hypothetical protein
VFSASLLSMMIHSLPPAAQGVFLDFPPDTPPEEPTGGVSAQTGQIISGHKDLRELFDSALRSYQGKWPRLPLIGRSEPDSRSMLRKHLPAGTRLAEDGDFLWGRVPLDALIRHFLAAGSVSLNTEHLDLGTPVRGAAAGAGAGPNLANFLNQTVSPTSAHVGVALVDLGETKPAGTPGVPRSFGGKLRHVPYPPGTLVDLSTHAEQVLEVLLDRLSAIPNGPVAAATTNMLPRTTVSMALVINPNPDVVRGSLDCFHQHGAPEMLDAVKAIDKLLDGDNLPAAVNVSLGTHVGPHNGGSPLEQYISGTLFKPSERFLFASAGNEGNRGISARLDLLRGEADYMELVVSEHCTELLVEFWWDDAGPADLEVMAHVAGGGASLATIVIRPGLAGTLLAPAPMGKIKPMAFMTLLQSKSSGTMSCIAFALTRAPPAAGGQLPELRISFDLTTKSADAAVHAWVVICDQQQETAFIHAGPEGTVSAPASDPKVVSVAGFDKGLKQMWRSSSRGPASRYSPGSPTQSPAMAHLCHSIGLGPTPPGTSFASPRATADAAEPLADPNRRKACTEVEKLIKETYGSVAPTWDPRHGFRKQDY